MRYFLSLSLAILSCFFLASCSQDHSSSEKNNEIRVGTIAGPETELMEVAKHVADAKYALNVVIVPFTDYVLPNQALADGSIDANMFQHQPYLEETIKAKGYQLSSIGKTFVYPMGIYSKKIKNISDAPTGAIVAIPNDPSNEARALLLLAKTGLIELKPETISSMPTLQDIKNNPKNLQFKELDAAQLPRVLVDVDLAVINTNYAMLAGLLPSRDALFIESANSPYANIVVIRTQDKNKPKYNKFMEALHSSEVVSRANKLFQGQAIKAW